MNSYYVVCALVLIVAGLWGMWDFYEENRASDDGSGWVYFIGNGEGTPIKVGMSRYDPSERLKDIKAMSPQPLHVYYQFQVADRRSAEARVHAILAPHRDHGEWFDRDATLAFISNLKGEYK